MLEFENSLSVGGDIYKVYDLAEKYFPNQGFSLDRSNKPNRLVFKKKGSYWTTDVRKIPQTLYVTILRDDKGTITIIMNYVSHVIGNLGSNGKRKLDSDITAFKDMLLNSLQPKSITCLKCGSENPINANYCNNCGERLDLTRAY